MVDGAALASVRSLRIAKLDVFFHHRQPGTSPSRSDQQRYFVEVWHLPEELQEFEVATVAELRFGALVAEWTCTTGRRHVGGGLNRQSKRPPLFRSATDS